MNDKQAACKAKFAALNAKMAEMTDERKNARVEELYGKPTMTKDETDQLSRS